MIFIERFEFTYQDYLIYRDSFYFHFHDKQEKFLCVAEDEEEYTYEELDRCKNIIKNEVVEVLKQGCKSFIKGIHNKFCKI